MTRKEKSKLRKRIAKEYKTGHLTTKELALKFQTTIHIVYSALKEHNLPVLHRAKDREDGKRFCVLGKHWEFLNNFTNQPRGKFGKSTKCKSCAKMYQLGYYSKRWAYNVSRRYNITVEQYYTMLEQQQNKCAVCGNGQSQRLSVDHDHATGVVRALLCYPCNTILGLAKDSPERLEAGAAYLRQHLGNSSGLLETKE
jgi:hypothetical protein